VAQKLEAEVGPLNLRECLTKCGADLSCPFVFFYPTCMAEGVEVKVANARLFYA
jgi:hypothetical protein